MEKNIFEGAKFGDKFKLYQGVGVYVDSNTLYIENWGLCSYEDNGHTIDAVGVAWSDIQCKYQECIDEEKLDNLAEDYMDSLNPQEGVDYGIWEIGDAFKAGYRKAKDK